MSYRDSRKSILQLREEFPADHNVNDDIIQYDVFFTTLLELRTAMITKDELSPDLFERIARLMQPVCSKEDFAYFKKTPLTSAGLEEYYHNCMSTILPFFPKLEKDIQETIEENAKRYSKYVTPTVTVTAEVPANTPVSVNIDIRKELRLPTPSKESYKKRKENTSNDARALKYEQKLFRIYLSGLIDYMGYKYPEILTDTRYKTFDDEKAPEYVTKGRKDYLTTRDGIFFMIDRVSQKTPSERQYIQYNAQELFLHHRFKKKYSVTALSDFLSQSDCADILYDMVIESVRPLIEYEWGFSIDATGISTTLKNDYNFTKHGDGGVMYEGRMVKQIEWVNLQALTCQTANLVVIPRIYPNRGSAEQYGIIPMVEEALKEGFRVERLCADKAYAGKAYREALSKMGVDYYCEFPSNVNPPAVGDESIWAKQFRYQKEHPEEFSKRYHARSTVESVFGAIKHRVGEKISSKSMSGYIKEVYCKTIVYNIYGMIHQLFVNGIVPEYVDVEEVVKVVKMF